MARKPDPRKPLKARPNPLDAARITYIDYKDTDLLRKFISDRGKIRSRRVSRVSAQQQRHRQGPARGRPRPAPDGTRRGHRGLGHQPPAP
ncbi:30S ribosomal protein S18, partial [Streptomyces microflavus]|uniref:30S ribosomal protein S18 n=1 Tax=Streptomyces microflavus TaxID=1919 RepID=UPI003F4CA5CE